MPNRLFFDVRMLSVFVVVNEIFVSLTSFSVALCILQLYNDILISSEHENTLGLCVRFLIGLGVIEV